MDKDFREQPLEEPANALNVVNEESAVSENGSLEQRQEESSENLNSQSDNFEKESQTFGKFKNAEALLEAYNNLQSEFTKKCQRLSELEKDKTEKATQEQNTESLLENNLNQFLSKNAEAKDYAEELKQKISIQGDYSENAFQNVWAGIVLDHIKSKACVQDKIVDKYVLSDENVKNIVIQNYLNSLKENSSPIVISSKKGERVSDLSSDTPTSLNDARIMMERLFN